MSTIFKEDPLTTALFGKTRMAVLSLMYSHPDESFYLRQIVKTTGVGMGAVQRELKNLSEANIIRRTVRGNQVYFQANPGCPVYKELKSLIVKTAGAVDILKAAFIPLAERIKVAFIYGSVARGVEKKDSDLDLLIIGDVTFSEIVEVLGEAQKTLGREVNPTVYPVDEYRSKIIAGHHFLQSVIAGEKIFLFGDSDEL